MSGNITPISIGILNPTATITTSGTYAVSVLVAGTVDIQGSQTAPIDVTVSESGVLGLGLLTTTNIADADVVLTGLANVSALSPFNLGENSLGQATGNGTLELGAGLVGVTALDPINFVGTNDKLIVDTGINLNLLDSINDFAPGDQIELKGVTATSATFIQNSGAPGGTIDFYNSTGTITAALSLATGTFASNAFHVTPDPNGGVDLTVCFLEGTKLLGLHGDIAVEDMEPGDRLITDSGAMRPVKWVGRRTIDASRHPRPETVWPIRIEAGAIDHGLPERTLYLSPDHAIFIDGCLIPAKILVNGRSIVQEPRDRFTYFHVELESHDILLAESLPVESYLETGNRNFFENSGAAMVLHPHMAQIKREAEGCAPFHEHGDQVTAIRNRLLERLPKLRETHDCRLRALTDQGELNVTVIDSTTYRIDLAYPDANLVLVSNAMVPAEYDAASRDRRRLGLDIAALEIETTTGIRTIDRDEPALRAGWHIDEATHRWTNGEAMIPASLLEGGHALIVRLNAVATYAANPAAERDAARVADLVMVRQMTALRRLGLLD
jgi:PKD repeat protein